MGCLIRFDLALERVIISDQYRVGFTSRHAIVRETIGTQ